MNSNQIHFILQGKGGVGKSLIAAILVQYFADRHGAVKPFDTDPVNDTLSQYKAFSSRRIDILDQMNNITAREFDGLIEDLLTSDNACVVDNGASTFIPLMSYMVENKAIELLQDAGKKVLIHSVITGGQAFDDTLQGLSIMLHNQTAPIIVWLNEFFGVVERDGRAFVDSTLYQENQARIHSVIRIEKGNPDTFGKDMELLGKSKLTFDEAQQSSMFSIMPRQRLKMVRQSLFAQLDAASF